jgi:hypothetical protein
MVDYKERLFIRKLNEMEVTKLLIPSWKMMITNYNLSNIMLSKGPHFSVKKRGVVFVVFQGIAIRTIVLRKYNPKLKTFDTLLREST